MKIKAKANRVRLPRLKPTAAMQIAKTSETAIQFCLSIALARLLLPSQYGQYSIASGIAAVSMLIVAFGVEESLERGAHSRKHLRTALFVRGACICAFAAVASGVALSVGVPIELTVSVGLLLVGGSALSLANSWAIVARRSWCTVFAIVLGSLISITFAIIGLTRDPIVVVAAASVSIGQLTSTGLLLLQRPSGPAPAHSASSFRPVNMKFAASNGLAALLGKQLDVFILAAFGVASSEIGYYSLAFTLVAIAGTSLISGIGASALRMMSLAESTEAASLVFRKTSEISLILGGVPVLFLLTHGLSAITIAYGDAYRPAITFILIFGSGSIISRLLGGGTSQSMLYKQGRESVSLLIRVIAALSGTASAFIVTPVYGAVGVATVTASIGVLICLFEFISSGISLKTLPIWRAGPALLIALVPGLIIPDAGSLPLLVVIGFAMMTLAIAVWFILVKYVLKEVKG